ncbi:partial Mobilization protein A, partial [Methylophilaceae bacterium]
MATYHLTVKAGQRGKAKPHADYIAREGKYSGSTRYEDLEAKQYGNMPAWAEHNPSEFWQAADDNERANGSAYREIEIALPRELTPHQRLELVQDFVSQELGKKHAYQFAIHTPKAALEKGEQPHAHIMYSERIIDGIERDPEQYFKRYNAKFPERGGNKKASGGKLESERKEELKQLRERWADIQNKHLEKHGHDERVSHLSLKEQGIEDREPEQHLGGSGVRNNAKKRALVELRAANAENAKAHAEAAPIVEQHKAQESFKDVAKSKAEEFKKRLAEKAQAKAQAEQAERDRIEQERIRKEIDQIHAQVAQEKARQQEQQRQAEREQSERTAREEAERKRQAEQQAELAKVEALKAQQKAEQEAQRQAER